MKRIHLLVGAISMAMASAAIAQDTSGSAAGTASGSAATGTMMQMTEAEKSATADWTGPIADALFTDQSKATLRSEQEIRSNWANLSAEQQNQIKEDCNTVQTAAAGTGTTTGTTTGATTPSGDTTASTTTGTTTGGTTGTTSGETTAGTTTETTPGTAGTATGAGGVMSVAQLCNIVQNM